MSEKPIRVFYNDISGTFWATQHYKETIDKEKGTYHVRITGKKYDVTQDIASAVMLNDLEFEVVQKEDPHGQP